jgi:hypothetical protein
MIRPNVRASFGRGEAELLLALAGPGAEERLRHEGLDALLDDVAVLRGLVRSPQAISMAPAPLVFYVLVRHALLQREIEDRQLADYTAALLLEFGTAGRAHRVEEEDEPLRYLADILDAIGQARGEREFLLRVHLGNYALWLAGIFPDWITTRVQRRGAPPLSYYDAMGSSGFRMAAASDLALRHGLGDLFVSAAERFTDVRSALNSLSDTLFFPHTRESVERLLRQVSDGFQRGDPG